MANEKTKPVVARGAVTKRADWVMVGQDCAVNGASMRGVVLRIRRLASGTRVKVLWSTGSIGNHPIQMLHALPIVRAEGRS